MVPEEALGTTEHQACSVVEDPAHTQHYGTALPRPSVHRQTGTK